MKRFALLVAAVLSVLSSAPATARPRGRTQTAQTQPAPQAAPAAQADGGSPAAPADAPDADDEGPEATAAAVFKLDDIIEVAVRQSPDLARARSDRDAAQAEAGAARKDQAWVLTTEVDYSRDAPGATNAEPLSTIADDKITGTVGLGRKLPTGGTVSFEVGVLHDRRELNVTGDVLDQATMQQSQCGDTVDIFCQDQVSAKLSLKQPLARGLGSEVALAPERKADLTAAQATLKAQLAAEGMLRDIIEAYWELANAAYEVDVRAESLELARKQDQLTRQEIRAGTSAPNALDEVSYAIVTRDDALLTAKLAFESKSLDLRRKAGLEITRRDIVVRPADPLELDSRDWNIDDILARSHKINRELASITLDKRIADVDVDVAHDRTKPQIDLSVSGAVLGTGDTGGLAISNVSSGDGIGYQVTAGLSMSFELSGAARSAHAAALARRHGLDIERVAKEREVDAEVVSSVKTLMSARTRIALDDKAIAIAEDNVKTERANFMAGHATNFQIMTKQGQLADAKLRRGRAVADYLIAVAKLQYLSGTLLDAYRIHVRARGDRDD